MKNADMVVIVSADVIYHIVSTMVVFYPQTRHELNKAISLWIQDKVSAKHAYGHISYWDVTAITNMSNLFEEQEYFCIGTQPMSRTCRTCLATAFHTIKSCHLILAT